MSNLVDIAEPAPLALALGASAGVPTAWAEHPRP